jgi:GDP-L-fucose synthase
MRLDDTSTVVVTGGTGFLGRAISAELRRTGARVHALGSKDYDLRDRDAIRLMLEDLRPDAVVHLAAVVGGIGANASQPGRFFYENAIMGIELIEACRVAGVTKTVICGTVCAYPKFTPLPFREDDLWNGYPEETNAPYGLAKKMLLAQTQAYRQQYGMNAVYLLPVNLYGPGDNFDLASSHVIPGMIRRFLTAKAQGDPVVTLWGDGSPTREFLYVDDAARALRLALEEYDGEEPVNIGSGQEISIRDLAALIREATGYAGEIAWDTDKPNGQPRRKLSTDRARDAFGFTSTTTLDEGIRETVRWYLETTATSADATADQTAELATVLPTVLPAMPPDRRPTTSVSA